MASNLRSLARPDAHWLALWARLRRLDAVAAVAGVPLEDARVRLRAAGVELRGARPGRAPDVSVEEARALPCAGQMMIPGVSPDSNLDRPRRRRGHRDPTGTQKENRPETGRPGRGDGRKPVGNTRTSDGAGDGI